jgi:hypothetical protein
MSQQSAVDIGASAPEFPKPALLPDVETPSLLSNARLWPVIDPVVTARDARRLRKALKRGGFDSGSDGPGSVDQPPTLSKLLRRLGIATAAAASGTFALAAFSHGAWAVTLIVVGAALLLPAVPLAKAGAAFARRNLSRLGRLIRRRRGEFLLPRHVGPEYGMLVDRAALAAESATRAGHPGLDREAVGRRLWQTAGRARLARDLEAVLAPGGIGGGGSGGDDEVVTEVLANATTALEQVVQSVTHDVEALEQLAAIVARADAEDAAVNRLRVVRHRTDQMAAMIADAWGDRPDLAGDMLQTRFEEAEARYRAILVEAQELIVQWPQHG